jgi:hypothetical protein
MFEVFSIVYSPEDELNQDNVSDEGERNGRVIPLLLEMGKKLVEALKLRFRIVLSVEDDIED